MCTALLNDLVARGVRTNRTMLFVVDGGKALCTAIRAVFGARALATTNPIEFLNSRIRKTTHNVTRWEGGEMVLRWLSLAFVEASKTFRKLRGYQGMPKLVAGLRAHDAQLEPKSVDGSKRAA